MHRGLILLGLLALGAAFVAGCLMMPESKMPRPVAEALDAPEKFILYSLEPAPVGVSNAATQAPTETFHGQTVLGKTEVRDAVTRRKLVAAFNRGVSDHDGSVAACFMPHHGVRIQKGKHTIDLVICFMCAQVYTYVDGEQTDTILISTSPRAVFNDVLDRAHIPVSKAGR
jgi:hypothetical protein